MKKSLLAAHALVVGAILLSNPFPAQASGTYRSRAPQPKLKAGTQLDRSLYALGQQVYDGKAPVAERAGKNASAQSQRLAVLQEGLPRRSAKSKNLPALAGRLSDQQLQALEYYVTNRFGQ